MNPAMSFAVIGGDMRQAYLAGLIKRDGFNVHTFALEHAQPLFGVPASAALSEALAPADCVLLPLPCMCDGIYLNAPLSAEKITAAEIFSLVRKDSVVLAGRADEKLRAAADSRGITLIDYLEREEFAVLNAIPTAEGAIQLAMEELPITLHGANCLLIGFGRIGRVLAPFLRGLGASVTVSVRKYPDRAWLRACGCCQMDSGNLTDLEKFDLIINTVPARMLGQKELSSLKNGCLCIDLASKPGGIDFSAAGQLGVHCIWALSLPGKVAPYTSAEIIWETACNILEERWRG